MPALAEGRGLTKPTVSRLPAESRDATLRFPTSNPAAPGESES